MKANYAVKCSLFKLRALVNDTIRLTGAKFRFIVSYNIWMKSIVPRLMTFKYFNRASHLRNSF